MNLPDLTPAKGVPRWKPWMEPLFWMAFCLLLVIHCVENTSLIYEDLAWMKAMYMVRNMLYVLLLAKAGFTAVYRPKELWFMLAVLPIGMLNVVFSGDFALMELAIIVIAAKDVSPRKLVKIFTIIKSVAMVLTIVLCLLKVLPNIAYENSDSIDYTYGFCHRNVLGANMAVLCLAWMYLRYKDLWLYDLVLWGGLTLVTYLLAQSRTSLMIMVLAIAAAFVTRRYEKKLLGKSRTRIIVTGFFVALFLVSLICTVFYKRYDPFWELVDKFFTKRLRFAHQCLDVYGFSIFGQPMDFVSTLEAQNDAEATRLILDNAFMRGLLHNGILPGGVFLLTYCNTLNRSWRRRNVPLVVCMLVMAVYGMSERYMLDVYYNFPLLVACISLFRRPNSQTIGDYRYPFVFAGEILAKIRSRLGAMRENAA